MKKVFKYIGRILLGFVVFVAVYLFVAFCLSRIAISKETNQPEQIAVYIKTNGVHTDLVVPVKTDLIDWSREIKFSNTHLADTTVIKYLAMGWGDKGFYLQTPNWSDLKFSVAFKAMTGLSNTAIHATYYPAMVETDQCKKMMVGNGQYERLVKYITDSFQKDSAGHLIAIVTNANYNNADAFYEANGSYSMFHTCNTWANSGLKASGQKACLWTPFDTGIFLQHK